MDDAANPYLPPKGTDDRSGWWSRLRALFQRPETRSEKFARGELIVCNGIAFFIEPDDITIVYAASPSSDFSERRMNLIVSEVIRVLPLFLAEHPDLHPHLRGRRLTIGMFLEGYDKRFGFRRAVPLEWDLLNAIL